ncbi:hypothetical protein OS493_037880 [Desmophyllum pertusum]|uniref:Uncharacterized protein n=1 Tax=Desmophyllum pertusum TaxID=174260 RepID=A0A9W9YHQ4_9CNID|nr:hypothetical protein OS493_037880 [Desmophyllum pertusum]
MEEDRSESGDEQDPPIQIDNSEQDAPELDTRPQRQRHPPTLLTNNTFGNPTYETLKLLHTSYPLTMFWGRQYLQYPSMHQLPVFQYPVNQYPVHHPVVYQPMNELMQVPVP